MAMLNNQMVLTATSPNYMGVSPRHCRLPLKFQAHMKSWGIGWYSEWGRSC